MAEIAEYAESCLHFCYLCLQNYSCAIYGSCNNNKICNYITAINSIACSSRAYSSRTNFKDYVAIVFSQSSKAVSF